MNKIEALKLTLDKLNDPNVKYEWTESDNCNCGILAQCIIGKERPAEGEWIAIWSNAAHYAFQNTCSKTGLPLKGVFASMAAVGFSEDDIGNLERLNNKEVCDRLGWKFYTWGLDENYPSQIDKRMQKRENVIAYITAWIEILEEEQGKPTHAVFIEHVQKEYLTPEKIYITVEIDSKVKELTKNLILS